MFVRAYLRASTTEQDAARARDQLDRFEADWKKLRAAIEAKQVRIVALDLPTSWSLAAPADEFTGRMFAAINSMLLDVLAAVARKDYDDRRRRQAQGQAKAKAAGLYKGRRENVARNAGIASMLRSGATYQQIMGAIGCTKPTIAKIRKRIDAEQAGATS